MIAQMTDFSAESVLQSVVLVAFLGICMELLKKWRSRGEKQTEGFKEMQAVSQAYRDFAEMHKLSAEQATASLHEVTVELGRAQVQISKMAVEIVGLKAALESAYTTIDRMVREVKKIDESSSPKGVQDQD